MLKKIKNYMVALAMVVSFSVPVLVPVTVHADIKDSLCKGTNLAISNSSSNSCGTNGDGTTQLGNVASKVVNFLSLIIGVIAVIMIIFAGFKYITSGGDSNNVSGAKNTLIYAIVGLIIVALAQFIVRFVLQNANVS